MYLLCSRSDLSHIRSDLFEHLTDGKLIGASRFTGAAAHAVLCRDAHGEIAGPRPISKTVAAQIIGKKKIGGDIDALRAGCAIAATAAKLIAQLLHQLCVENWRGYYNCWK